MTNLKHAYRNETKIMLEKIFEWKNKGKTKASIHKMVGL